MSPDCEYSIQLAQTFIEYCPSPVAIFDLNMRYVAVSESWFSEYRLKECNIVGRSHYDIFPETPDEWKVLHQRCLKGEVLKNDEVPFTRLDGSLDYISWEMRPWREDNGSIGGLIMYTEVITEKVLNRLHLVREEARLTALMQVAVEPCIEAALEKALELGTRELGMEIGIVSDIQGDHYRLRSHYAPGTDLTGNEQFSVGETYCSLALQREEPLGIHHMGQSSYKGHPCYQKFALESYIGISLRVGGHLFGTLNFSSAQPLSEPFTDADKRFVGLMARWISNALESIALKNELQNAVRSQREFFSVLAHDLRNQMNGSIFFTGILKDRFDENETEEREIIGDIALQFEETNAMLSKLLEWGRDSMESDSISINQEKLQWGEVTDQVFTPLRPEAAQKNITLQVVGEAGTEFFADRILLTTILRNLITNSFRALKAEGTIQLSISVDDAVTRFVVSDNGPGMSQVMLNDLNQEIIPRLPKSPDGSGFGLLICRSYTARHQGKISFENQEPQGLRVLLELPRYPIGIGHIA
ncbi:GAF domain-containing sensor histidine kinase [Rubellicoccus peritrichatus]|uniref:histidine kinase n=1 Tax=Rubellicoccus peritrichatus TaxID=3080537 RepID=A0AAQ3QVI6_9BACT|nr:ATP-binding protein [Puniceicoccus sp. CR14]WOO43456.1 ATP-binding protein [Puniceicoccus sp. CR14]